VTLVTSGAAQQDRNITSIPGLELSHGLAMFAGMDRSFVAVWSSSSDRWPRETTDMLCIFEKTNNQYKEVFRLAGEYPDWEDIISLGYPRLPGIVVLENDGMSERGIATLIVLVGNDFQVVYRGGESEFIDFNSDGIPEIVESIWPDGDGHPKTSNVYVWDGKKYKRLVKTKWDDRYGFRARQAVTNFFRSRKIR
jgi:hypothetical protein